MPITSQGDNLKSEGSAMARPHKPLFVRSLRRGERKKLERIAKRTRDARLVNRARMVLLSNQRKKLSEIGTLLDTAPTTVAIWIRRYEAEGIDGLYDRPRPGGPRKADEAYAERLIDLVETAPQKVDSGCPWGVWTVERLRARMEHEQFPAVSDDTVRRVLHAHGFAFLRPKLDVKHKQDPKVVKRFKRRLKAEKKGWTQIPA